MVTTDKVNVGESSTGTSTSTTYQCPYTYTPPKAEQGWECPRCGRINAPWVRQCDCSRNNWTITSDWTYKPDWWKEYTISVNGTQSNKVDSNVTAWSCTNPDNCHTPHYTTETAHSFYNLKTPKETE